MLIQPKHLQTAEAGFTPLRSLLTCFLNPPTVKSAPGFTINQNVLLCALL